MLYICMYTIVKCTYMVCVKVCLWILLKCYEQRSYACYTFQSSATFSLVNGVTTWRKLPFYIHPRLLRDIGLISGKPHSRINWNIRKTQIRSITETCSPCSNRAKLSRSRWRLLAISVSNLTLETALIFAQAQNWLLGCTILRWTKERLNYI